jgi:hypothetical protein
MGFMTIKEKDDPSLLISKLPPHALDKRQDDSLQRVANYRSGYERILAG